MSLSLELYTAPRVPLEAEVISPAALKGLSASGIAALNLNYGNELVPLGDFFRIKGSFNGELHIAGDLSRVKLVGARMSAGRIVIQGDAGMHLGLGMSGGEIEVRGNAADWVGPEMSGGRILVTGSAGHMVGAAYRGSPAGMQGGEIIVYGNVGNETGNAMRRGLIAVGGDSGDFTGVNMLAGSIIVLGSLGARTGAGMKRGTIVSMRDAPVLPTFSYACTYHPLFLRFYLLHLAALGLPIEPDYIDGRYQRLSGDSIELNRGEILIYESRRST
ncbi:MAG: formylmethanofuran dehydrogenase subunit C [Gammaproteobacteria bacterium]|nr:formylmethanofuran dehydrogenase subunit C [Gammaproteobacteria bacterium]MBA3731886.1 formylmethanofuran dehydrogenase subunit C [Gammaproteobacteria bacterium]